jgi:hypothetical protein
VTSVEDASGRPVSFESARVPSGDCLSKRTGRFFLAFLVILVVFSVFILGPFRSTWVGRMDFFFVCVTGTYNCLLRWTN